MAIVEHSKITTKKCAGALRISSTKQLEGDSLDDQKKIIEVFATKIGGEVRYWFSMVHSASGADIEKQPLNEVINWCKENKGKFEYLLVSRLDRFTRGGIATFDYLKSELKKYNITLLDAEGVIGDEEINTLDHLDLPYTYPWAIQNPSRQREVQEAERAKEEAKKIVTRTISAEIRYAQNGYWMRRPPYGYKSTTAATAKGKRKILLPDTEESAFIRLMFELVARGDMSDTEICNELNLRGYASRAHNKYAKNDPLKVIGNGGNKKLKPSQLRKYVSNLVYAGIICEKWTKYSPVKAQFQGIVTTDLFNRANKGKKQVSIDDLGNIEIYDGPLAEYKKKRHKRNPMYPYKDYVMCPICDNPLLGSASTSKSGKKHPAYHCSRGHKRFGINKSTFDETIETFTNSLEFSVDFKSKLLIAIKEEWLKREKGFNSKSLDINKQILDIDEKTEKYLESYAQTASSVMKEQIEYEVEKLQKTKRLLANSRNKTESDQLNMEKVLEYTKYYMEHLPELLTGNKDPFINASFFGILFEELPTYEELLNGTPNLSYIFKLNDAYIKSEISMVTLVNSNWNTLLESLTRIYNAIDLLKGIHGYSFV